MPTYFARHGSRLDLDAASLQDLRDKCLVGFHYPHESAGDTGRDSQSLNPDDYLPKQGGGALRRLWALASEGGTVCAVYDGQPGCLIGRVEGGGAPVVHKGMWGTKNYRTPREAVLKVVPLTHSRWLSPAESLSLLAARPRQGTFVRWDRGEGAVRSLLEGGEWLVSWDRMTPTQQEVMCSEFLRLPEAAALGLPQVESLTLPVGRTLKDIDIAGLTCEGEAVFGQVTASSDMSPAVVHKRKTLGLYGDGAVATGIHRVLFCDASERHEEQGVSVVPLAEVFEAFRRTGAGERWLKAVEQGR